MAAGPTFEELYAALEAKARRLEEGNLPLEESLRLYDEGARLVDQLREVLGKAELQVRTLQTRLDEGGAQARELEADYDELTGPEDD